MKIRYRHSTIVLWLALIGLSLLSVLAGVLPSFNFRMGSQRSEAQIACSVEKWESMSLDYNAYNFTWSPDGKRIAFESPRCRWTDIYVVGADGHNLKRLTRCKGAILPVFSPDGEKVAFSLMGDETYEIHVVDADGSNMKRLTQNSKDFVLKWSSEGKIYFLRENGETSQLYVMDADGSNQALLLALSDWGDCRNPVFSPDSKKVAFSSLKDGNWDIYVAEIGSTPQRVTDNPGPDTSPAWSPDSEKLAFGSQRNGTTGVYVMNADGSNAEKIADTLSWTMNIA